MIAGARNVVFFNRMLAVSVKSNLGCEAGCGLTVSFSDPVRIGSALEMTFQLFSRLCPKFWRVIFAWQAQYLVGLQ